MITESLIRFLEMIILFLSGIANRLSGDDYLEADWVSLADLYSEVSYWVDGFYAADLMRIKDAVTAAAAESRRRELVNNRIVLKQSMEEWIAEHVSHID